MPLHNYTYLTTLVFFSFFSFIPPPFLRHVLNRLVLNNTHHFQNPAHLRAASPHRRLLDPKQPHLGILP